MRKTFGLILLLGILMLLLTACGSAATPTAAQTSAPAATSAQISTEEALTEIPNTPSIGDQLAQIDDILKQSISASIAYNKPQSMLLDQTTTVQLLLNPSLSPEALSTQVTANGKVASASVQITPRMKAVLLSDDAQAFSIQPEQDNPEQLVSGTETTQWTWLVTAHKSGTQTLTLILYRFIQYQGQDYWREVESYQANIDVKITVSQQLGSLDWEWVAGIVLTALLIPAFWRWMDYRKKKKLGVNPKTTDAKKKVSSKELK
ncbi:MAG: hypothetical protein WBW94_03385 [Anaerolineales bacterium]